jgi:uncharacterized protein YyaL (SSP411 family)
MASSPLAAGQMLVALDFYLGPVQEFAIVGDAGAADTQKVLHLIRGGFRPNKVVAVQAALGKETEAQKKLPLLDGKTARGKVTTYICRDSTCQEPLIGVEAVEKALKE